jgi:probable rRNA maturation factor
MMQSQVCVPNTSRILTRKNKASPLIFLENETDHHVSTDKLEIILHALTERDIEMVVCDDTKISKLNKKYRSIDSATDVLSFPLDGDHSHLPLGVIVISYDHVLLRSSELGHSANDELTLLFIHGLLHLLGFDHETDNGQMRQKEHELIRRFDLSDSLIIRTEKFHD